MFLVSIHFETYVYVRKFYLMTIIRYSWNISLLFDGINFESIGHVRQCDRTTSCRSPFGRTGCRGNQSIPGACQAPVAKGNGCRYIRFRLLVIFVPDLYPHHAWLEFRLANFGARTRRHGGGNDRAPRLSLAQHGVFPTRLRCARPYGSAASAIGYAHISRRGSRSPHWPSIGSLAQTSGRTVPRER